MVETSVLQQIAARLEVILAAPARAYMPFVIDGQQVGRLTPQRAARLAAFPETFGVVPMGVTFSPDCNNVEARSAALERVARQLALEGALSAWRDERYPVVVTPGGDALCHLERAAARYFGIHTSAVHVNGLVRAAQGDRMWFARRSASKAIDPAMLDNLVGGGIAAGSSPAATLVKEAWEEAGIPASLAGQAEAKGIVRIERDQPDGLQHETIFVHDLWLPPSFVPANQDGEAVAHRLVDLDDAARLLANEQGADVVTADASLVALDFLLRQQALPQDAPLLARLSALRGTATASAR
jgi:8-oxo-dGTP pyrophosphatase MutT (NUDIX family)